MWKQKNIVRIIYCRSGKCCKDLNEPLRSGGMPRALNVWKEGGKGEKMDNF